MNFSLSVTAKARDDITRNAAWWAEHYPLDEALRWYDALYEQLDTLKQFPERHGIAPENDEFEYEIREKPLGLGSQGTYRAVFTIVDLEVRVLAVRRASQDTLTPEDLP